MRGRSRGGWCPGVAAFLLALACGPIAAHAVPVMLPTNTGIRTFDSEQFASSVVGSDLGGSSTFQGPFPAAFDTLSVAAAILGADLSNGIGITRNNSIILGFLRPGPLLAIWEAGALSFLGPTRLEASLDGGATFGPTAVTFQPVAAVPDSQPSGYQTNYQELDATRFGLPGGSAVNALRISVLEGSASYLKADVLAVAIVPEPSSLTLLAFGLVGIRMARRITGSPRRGA